MPSTVQDAPQVPQQKTPVKTDDTKIAKLLESRASNFRKKRKRLMSKWKRSVDLRLGYSSSAADNDPTNAQDTKSEANPDWALTKTKTANLFGQVPTVRATYENKQYSAAVGPFLKTLNYELGAKRANIGPAMEEVMNDVVNAAGIGGILVGYIARSEKKMVPVQDNIVLQGQTVQTAQLNDDQVNRLAQAGLLKLQPTDVVADYRFTLNRVSPADLIVPVDYTGSDFNDADFAGYDGKMPATLAQTEFDLTDDEVQAATGEADDANNESLRSESDKSELMDTKTVRYSEIFYWRYRFDPNEKSLSAIWRVVFVQGKSEPVKHEQWKGQKYAEGGKGKYIGSCRLPLQILTITYVTDNAIPPSDSEAGRPQVMDMRRSRSQMFANREFSRPLRGFDVNRIDPLVQENLMRGTWQGMIPVNGNGQNSIWEVARASYPAENMAFDQATKTDLQETWQIGAQQMGMGGNSTGSATGDNLAQQNFATRMGQERNRVAAFFVACCDVLAGLLVLYSDFPNLSDQEKQAMEQAWNDKQIAHDLVFTLLPDSTIVLDSQAKIQKLAQFLSLTVKSGLVNPAPIITEMALLSGLDPAEVIMQPQPKDPQEANVSLRLTGKHDLMNATVMGMLVKLKQAPSPDDMNTAKKILLAAQDPNPVPDNLPGAGGGAPGSPDGQPPPEGGPGAVPNQQEDQQPGWSLSNKVAKRSDDLNQ